MPEFTSYQRDSSPEPVEFKEVISRLPENEVFWPCSTTIAKMIFEIVCDTIFTDTHTVYEKIASIKTQDLRPHLLMLLKGFSEDGKSYKITRFLFETLHAWVELNLSYYHTTASVITLSAESGMSYLTLDSQQTLSLQQTLQNSKNSLAEKTIFLVPVNDEYIFERVLAIFQSIKYLVSTHQMLYPALKENIRFLNKFLSVFDMSELKDIVSKLERWLNANEKRTPQQINDDTWVKVEEFSFVDIERAESTVIKKCNGKVRPLTATIRYEHTLLDYQYENDQKIWFFPFLGSFLFSLYSKATTQLEHSDMIFCYGKISASEFVDRKLNKQPRLGNFSHFTLDQNQFKKRKIHYMDPHAVADNMLHDASFHRTLYLGLSYSSLEKIIYEWIYLIREKTQLLISHETFILADLGFSESLLCHTAMEKFYTVFQHFYYHTHDSGIVYCMILLHIILNNYYNLISPSDQMPKLLQKIQNKKDSFLEIYNNLSEKQTTTKIDPFLVTSLCIFSTLNANAKFTAQLVCQHPSLLSYRWKKQRVGNYAELLISANNHLKPEAARQELSLFELDDQYIQSHIAKI